MFPISRDPPEGGTPTLEWLLAQLPGPCFQFLGIPPKGEQGDALRFLRARLVTVSNF